MYLKSLTAKGFKSFASATTLNFEPGITCVVGPNGSGKSNVVDALSWVMGEQGAKTLRGGKMDDVIFAGTTSRPPLGRAEVALTIDNTDGALPIEYTEVTIARTLFRGGGSEYSINGAPCRLLDIQELLSDSGIGREIHVVVGQGQLDKILSATPEERRGFIEEAAGVLKHRRRKEKALRKLEATEGNLIRLQDLTNELRRQLKPLGRQAELARKAAVFQADARDARLRLLADDLLQLQTNLNREIADENLLRERQSKVEQQIAQLNAEISQLEEQSISSAPRMSKAQDAWFTLSSLRERYFGLRQVVSERIRLTSQPIDEQPRGLDPEVLDQQAKTARNESQTLQQQDKAHREKLALLTQARTEHEIKFTEAESALAFAAQSAADRREQLAKLAGDLAAAQSKRDARSAEIQRLNDQVAGAVRRAGEAEAAYRREEAEIAGLDAGELQLGTQHEQAALVLDAAAAKTDELLAQLNLAERAQSGSFATVAAIEAAIARNADGGKSLIANNVSGISKKIATELKIKEGYELAVAAALAAAANAVIAPDSNSAFSAIEYLKNSKQGRAAIVLASAAATPSMQTNGGQPVVEFISATGELATAIKSLLFDCVVVADLATAIALQSANPELRVVTKDGDLVARGLIVGGGEMADNEVSTQAALQLAQTELTAAGQKVISAKNAYEIALHDQQTAQGSLDVALAKIKESEVAQAQVALRLAELSQQSRAAAAEADRLKQLLIQADVGLTEDQQLILDSKNRLETARNAPSTLTPITPEQRDLLLAELVQARSNEVEERLTLRTAEERYQVAVAKISELELLAAAERDSRVKEVQRRQRLQREAVVAAAVSAAVDQVLDRLESSVSTASTLKADLEQQRAERETRLQSLRQRARELEAERSTLVDSVHRDELARTEQRARIEAIEEKALSDFGVSTDVLASEYGPDQLVPPSIRAIGDDEDQSSQAQVSIPYLRAEQEKRAKEAERQLALLGRVNPLALEEFQAMEERHKFLGEQVEDVKRTKSDLEQVIKEVDDRVQQVFAEAFADTAREFEGIFSRLFPGGEGKLVLVDPDNLLLSGVDVEARPAGKKIKRLSLLSGGERSLVAVAFLISLFKARPSPFYVLDEVEAALDDINLGRLLEIYKELRENSQLIVITHQKRTMEIADALYGVSMRNDGVSALISQRIRDVSDQLVES